MRSKVLLGLFFAAFVAVTACVSYSDNSVAAAPQSAVADPTPTGKVKTPATQREIAFIDKWDGQKLVKTDTEWKKELSAEEYYVLRKQGTERAYTGALNDNKKEGTYYCAACGLALFKSAAKYDSETGWPSFYKSISNTNVAEEVDRTIPSEVRTEVHCARCGGHLGHVFDDGPDPTGLRYCMNSVSLRFKPSM